MDNALVSVLICTYNADKFIIPTLKSIYRQTYKNLEILILDNNSSDKTVGIINDKFKYDNIKLYTSYINLGPYKGLNFLLEKCNGKYIAIADHDDIYHPTKIEKQVRFLEKNKHYIGCGTNLYKFFENKKDFKIVTLSEISTFTPHPSIVFRNNGYRYNDLVEYQCDKYFMKYVLCNNIPALYTIQEPLYLSRVRYDQSNLSYIWNKQLTLKKILNYYHFSKDTKVFVKMFVKMMINYNLVNKIANSINRKSTNDLRDDPLFKDYLEYLE